MAKRLLMKTIKSDTKQGEVHLLDSCNPTGENRC